LSQFGSFIRPVIEVGEWGFLTFPLREMGISGAHPLYRLVPEAWRVPSLPWPAEDRAQRWASAVEYIAAVASPRPETIEKVFRWHLFSWVLSNLAAISYSDFALDIDKTHDDAGYRKTVIENLALRIGKAPDFGDIRKFDRYYEFESFDVVAVCNQVDSTIRDTLKDGRLDKALHTLAPQAPLVTAAAAVELLLAKISVSLAAMKADADRRYMRAAEWKSVAEKNRRIWFNPSIRRLLQNVYPITAPLVRAARRVGLWN
jgi:hypothetical protein